MKAVLLVDDHPVMRALLRQILENYPDIVIVAEAEDGENAVRQAMRLKPTVALIDCHLPRLSGVEVTELIKVKSPHTIIIGLTAGEPSGSDMEMVTAGAMAVLNKADVFQHLYPLIVKSCADAHVQATIAPTHFSSAPLRDSLR
jgi:DNA-binding NarL/FixJ family response regulator